MRLRNYTFIFLIFTLIMNTVYPVFGLEEISHQSGEKPEASDWLQKAMGNIRDLEYEASWQNTCAIPGEGPGYHMVNRKQDLRLYFYPDEIKVIRRTESSPSWILGFSLSAIGRGKPSPLYKPRLESERNIIKYLREGINETYENTRSGIKHNLLIQKSPEGSAPLGILFSLEGNLIPQKANNSAIIFQQNKNTAVELSGIRAIDAEGNILSLNTKLEDSGLLIEIQDNKAVYPVQIDYLLSTPAPWIAESDKEGAVFGVSVCTAGDVNGDGYSDLIVGASTYDNGMNDEGKAYVYYGSPNGPGSSSDWEYESNVLDAHLGYSVSTAGDVNGDGFSDVIIGARNYSVDQAGEGAALVFYGSQTGLGSTLTTLEGNQVGCNFGCSVSTAGDVNADGYSDVIVGAEYYDISDNSGRVFIYKGSEQGIVTTAFDKLTTFDADSRFGCSVKTAGDVNNDGYADVIVGAVIYENGQQSEGAAFVFRGGETGMNYEWKYEPDQEYYYCGTSVSTAGDVNGDGFSDVIVGMNGYENGQSGEGGALIFHGSSSGLSENPDLIIEPNKESTFFGNAVSTAGDMDGDGYGDVIVGAHFYESSKNLTWEGAAYIYRGSKAGLKTYYDRIERSNQAYAEFGYSVSTAGDINGDGYSDVIVGAPYYDNGEDKEGRCYLYYGKPKPPESAACWTESSSQANSDYGMSVASAGDVNSDGCSDIIVGASLFDNGQTNEGKVWVFLGQANDAPYSFAMRTLEGGSENAYFGACVASAGDVNADGYDDIIIGAPGYNNFKGRALVYLGGDSGTAASPVWIEEMGEEGDQFGRRVASAGDVNGDGYSDVIVGASSYSSAKGRALVYHGNSYALSMDPNWEYVCDQDGAFFGHSVASAGDVNCDGYADVIIGATGYTNGETDEGRAYVFHGSYKGLGLQYKWIGEANQASAVYGQSVSSAGDVNGDGYSDIIVGAPYYNNSITNQGAAFVYKGGPNGISGTTPFWTGESNQEDSRYGYSVATLGDANGDGYSDIIVGAYLYDTRMFLFVPPYHTDFPNGGSAHVYLGSSLGPSGAPDRTYFYYQNDAHLGRCVSGAGDVNGDGYADVIIGMPGYKPASDKIGQASVYFGGGGNGAKLLLSQVNRHDFIRKGRMVGSEVNGCKFLYNVKSPFGRIKVKAEFEYKNLGTPFDGNNTITSPSWIDLSSEATFMAYRDTSENTIFHWRVRALYDRVTCPFQNHSPWFSIPWNSWEEGDIRLGPDDTPSAQDIVNYLLAKSPYPHDVNEDGDVDAGDVVYIIIK